MSTYIIRRLSFGAILIFLSTIVSFAILKLSPGQAGATEIDPRLSREYVEQQQRLFGFDQPPAKQYLNWLGVPHLLNRDKPRGLVQGDLGLSVSYKQPVGRVIAPRLLATLGLNLIAFFLTWSVAIPLGTYAAMHQYKLADKALSLISFVGMSLPGFFLALLLLWIFCSHYQALPPGGLYSLDHELLSFRGRLWDDVRHLVVPVTVLVVGALAGLQRVSRGNMLEVLRQQYVTTARAKGLNPSRVVYKHALRNAVNPLVTMLGFEFAALFGGAALLETVINYPGMGQLMLEALRAKDQAVVMAVFLLGSIMLVIGNLLGEILLAWVDPRIRYD